MGHLLTRFCGLRTLTDLQPWPSLEQSLEQGGDLCSQEGMLGGNSKAAPKPPLPSRLPSVSVLRSILHSAPWSSFWMAIDTLDRSDFALFWLSPLMMTLLPLRPLLLLLILSWSLLPRSIVSYSPPPRLLIVF